MRITDILFPPKCIVCGKLVCNTLSDVPFCLDCYSEWENMCALCRYDSYGQPTALFSREMFDSEHGGQTLYAVYYVPGNRELPANRLIFHLKNRGERRCVGFCAAVLSDMLCREASVFGDSAEPCRDVILTWIPRRRESVMKYGFDHMRAVSKRLGRHLGIPVKHILKRRLRSREQKLLDSKSRYSNVKSSFYIPRRVRLDGMTVVVIDDIITTGASFDAAASLLLERGARQVIAAAVAKTERPLD